MTIMKLSGYFALIATFGLCAATQASAVAPSVTGTVQQVTGSTVTVDGHTYQVTADTKSDPTLGSPHPGQQVRLFLSSDGGTVIVISPSSPTPTH
jgi:hypothetical protein